MSIVTWDAKELHCSVISLQFLKGRRSHAEADSNKVTKLRPASLLKFIRIFLLMADASKQWSWTGRAGANHRVQANVPHPAMSLQGWEARSTAPSDAMTSPSYWILSSAESRSAIVLWRQHKKQVDGLHLAFVGSGILQFLMKLHQKA